MTKNSRHIVKSNLNLDNIVDEYRRQMEELWDEFIGVSSNL